MSPRIAWIVLASLALPSRAFAQAEEEVVAAIRARLDGRWLLLGVAKIK